VVTILPAFFTGTFSSCKVNTTVFVVLFQLLRKLKYDDDIVVVIQVTASKFATYGSQKFTLRTHARI